MKKKILSVLLALVLVLSFSLMTAVPVAAATGGTVTFEFNASDLLNVYPDSFASQTVGTERYDGQLNARGLRDRTGILWQYNTFSGEESYNAYLNWRDGIGSGEGISAFNIWLVDEPIVKAWGETIVKKPGAPVTATYPEGWNYQLVADPYDISGFILEWYTTDPAKYLRPGEDQGVFSFTVDVYEDVGTEDWDDDDPAVQVGETYRIWFGSAVNDDSSFHSGFVFDNADWGTLLPTTVANSPEVFSSIDYEVGGMYEGQLLQFDATLDLVAKAATINVPADYSTIQEAINAVAAGGTINVAAGTYTITSTINVNQEVTITGDTGSPENVIVQYNPADITQSIFEITASNVTIEGIKTISGRYAVGFNGGNPTGGKISRCILDQAGRRGISIWSNGGSNHTIEYTTISNVGPSADGDPIQEAGILVYGSSGITIQHNNISNVYQGIWVWEVNDITIDSNTISSIKDQGHPGNSYNGAPGINVQSGTATSTENRIEVTNNTISDTYWQGILVNRSPYTYVYNNTVSDSNYYGIDGTGDWDYAAIHIQESNDKTAHSDYVIVDSNTVYDSINGIQIWADHATVTNNEVYNMGLTYADEKVVGDRTYKNSGILVGSNFGSDDDHDPTGVVIENNNIHDNYWGLFYSADLTNGVTAENNWWGDASGPLHPTTNPTGQGNEISDNVDFMPWYATETTTPERENVTVKVGGTEDVRAYSDTIQGGITAASSGDTVNVAAGIYSERQDLQGTKYTNGAGIIINKSLTLLGANAGVPATETRGPESIITAPLNPLADFAVVIIGAGTVATFDGFTIDNYEVGGILAGSFSLLEADPLEVHILNNIVSAPSDIIDEHNNGIQVGDGTTGTIIGNKVFGAHLEHPDWSGSGILVAGSSGVLVKNNYAQGNDLGIAVSGYVIYRPAPAENNVIENNVVEGNEVGISVQMNSIGTVIRYNDVINNDVGIESAGNISWEPTVPSGTEIHYNNIIGNTLGVASIDWGDGGMQEQVDAAFNWWGDASGPTHILNLNGDGDAVSDNVDFIPWYATSTTMQGTEHVSVDHLGSSIAYSDTIQGGIDAAIAGDTVNVAAGTYDPFTIDGKTGLTIAAVGDVTIEGVQYDVDVVYRPPHSNVVVLVNDSTDIVLDGLNIQGGVGLGDAGTGRKLSYGILYQASTGIIRNSRVSPNTVDTATTGLAVGIISTVSRTSVVTIEDSLIENFGHVGIYIRGNVDILASTIVGHVYNTQAGVQNGIEVAQVLEAPGDDFGITFGSQVIIDGTEIYNNDNTFLPEPDYISVGILINCWLQWGIQADSTVTITNSNIHDNYTGIHAIESALSSAHYNNIHDNRVYGVESYPADPDSTLVFDTFDAKYNWWGHASGPIRELTNGNWVGKKGDKVSGNVNYKPWLHKSKEKIAPNKMPAFAQSVDLVNTGEYGWNTFSAPIFLDEEADNWNELWELELDEEEVPYSLAYRFDSGIQEFVPLTTTDDYPITPGEGFFIKMNDVGSLPILYSTAWNPIPPTRPLRAGWNLIGLASLKDMPVEDAFFSLAGEGQIVSPTWNKSPGAVFAGGTIYVGEAYWVYMLGARTLVGFTMTPVLWGQ